MYFLREKPVFFGYFDQNGERLPFFIPINLLISQKRDLRLQKRILGDPSAEPLARTICRFDKIPYC